MHLRNLVTTLSSHSIPALTATRLFTSATRLQIFYFFSSYSYNIFAHTVDMSEEPATKTRAVSVLWLPLFLAWTTFLPYPTNPAFLKRFCLNETTVVLMEEDSEILADKTTACYTTTVNRRGIVNLGNMCFSNLIIHALLSVGFHAKLSRCQRFKPSKGAVDNIFLMF